MSVDVVFWSVVLAALRVALFIPKYPLPAIIGGLVLDAADQTIFRTFGLNPPFHQSYDKAMDVFYLSVAYTAGLRNWANLSAFRINRFSVLLPADRCGGVRVDGPALAVAGGPEYVQVLLHRL